MQLIPAGVRPAGLIPHLRRFGFSGVLAVGVVFVLLVGSNPIATLTGQKPPRPPTSTTGVPVPDALPEALAAYPVIVGAEAEQMWRYAFLTAKIYFPEVEIAVVPTAAEFGCNMSGKDLTVFYCPEKATVFVDLGAYERLRAANPKGADYALAFLVAQSFGRHVQNTLGVFGDLAAMAPAARPAAERRADLQSVCYAALWAATVRIQGLFDDPEVVAAIALVEANRDRSILTEDERRAIPEAFERSGLEDRKVWEDKAWAIPAGGTCALYKIEAAGHA